MAKKKDTNPHNDEQLERRTTRNFRLKGFHTTIAFSAMTTHVKHSLSFEEQFEAKSIAFASIVEALQK